MTTQTVAPKLLDDLILTRLLVVGKRPIGPAKLRDDVNRLREAPPGAEEWDAALQEMEAAGLLTRKPLQLTDAGQAQALAFLGLETLPSRTDWRAVQTRYLIPRALGVPAEATAARKRLGYANNLRAAALRKAYNLPIPETATLTEAVEAAACEFIREKLDLEPQPNLKALMRVVLNRMLNPSTPLSAKKLMEHLPGHALGVTRGGMQGLREAIVARWLESDNGAREAAVPPTVNATAPEVRPTQPPAPVEESRRAELDLPTFAATVQAVARSCPTGRWGDNKVFINHVWRQFQQEPNVPHLDLAAFKAKLAEANQQGLLRLERADLVQAMDENDVRDSEMASVNAVYHFILIEGNRP